jgi:hypothetical protein
MSFLSKILAVSVLALVLGAPPVIAREPGVPPNVPPGSSMGVPVGMNPPPGLYFGIHSGYWMNELKDAEGDYGGHKGNDVDVSLQLVWVSRETILGGSYRAYLTLPLVYTDIERESPYSPQSGWGSESKRGIGAIEISPLNLSWELSPGVFLAGGFSFFAPTGAFDAESAINQQGDFWTFAPSLGFTYLRDDWNLSMLLIYFTSTESNDTDYQSGDEILFNFSALRDVGGWSIGPVGHYGGTTLAKTEQIGLGVGFNARLGGYETNINLTHDVYVRQGVGGAKLWFKIIFPLAKG